ncbi:hypothetical protein KY289_008549 [Solanum tuberosum]|nr:hypothetical protein KY289_008549 [Solanum tuberosum]
MADRIYFRLGGKSYDLTKSHLSSGTWFEWVEDARLYMRRMKLSSPALSWLCKRFQEASDIKGKSFKAWKCRDRTTHIYCNLKFNTFGRFLSVITVNGEERSVIILPENAFNEGWTNLLQKIEPFINDTKQVQKLNGNTGGTSTKGDKGKGSYKDAIQRNRWSANYSSESLEKNNEDDTDPLRRSLVGCFPGCDEIPTRNDLRKWVHQTWQGIFNIQIFDLNGIQFLFEFQSRRDAENVLAGRWMRNNQCMELEWWSPTTGAFPMQKKFDWFWIRILGLPLQLWSDEVMKDIGDQCGGWLETEEETQLRNHLRWARIRVRGPMEDIPTTVEVDDGESTFTLPVWCEAPARFRPSSDKVLEHREARKQLFRGESSLMGTSQSNYPLDNGKYNEDKGLQETFISKRKEGHVALTEGHVVALIQKMGPDLIKEQLGLLGLLGHLKNNKESGMKEVQCPHTSKIPEAEPFIDNILGQEAMPSPRPCLSEEELGMLESPSPGTLECVKEREDGSVEGENRPVAIIEEFGGGESFNYSDKEAGPRGDEGAGQLTNFEEPLPLQINDSFSEQEIEDKASLWVQSNVLKLSQLFGAAFEGCDKVAFDLFLRIDQKRGELTQKAASIASTSGKKLIPKEIKNLEFHVKFKEGEPRSRGRITSANYQ